MTLKHVKKWIITYHGQAVAVGDTPFQAIEDAIRPSLLLKKASM